MVRNLMMHFHHSARMMLKLGELREEVTLAAQATLATFRNLHGTRVLYMLRISAAVVKLETRVLPEISPSVVCKS